MVLPRSHISNWTIPSWSNVKLAIHTFLDLLLIFACMGNAEAPELYADTSKKLSSDHIQCISAVVGEEISGLTVVPEDRVFSILDTTMKLAAFDLPSQAGEKAILLNSYF